MQDYVIGIPHQFQEPASLKTQVIKVVPVSDDPFLRRASQVVCEPVVHRAAHGRCGVERIHADKVNVAVIEGIVVRVARGVTARLALGRDIKD